MIYYFVEFAGSLANIALLVLFVDRLFQKKDLYLRWFYLYIALLITGQCILSLFPTWVMPRTIYLLLGGFLLAILFYEAQIWQAIFASAAFFTLIAVVEILAMLLIGLRIPDTAILMQAGAARLIYVVFSNLIQIPLVVLISHFFSRKENVLRILWLLPIIVIQIASIAVCYIVQYLRDPPQAENPASQDSFLAVTIVGIHPCGKSCRRLKGIVLQYPAGSQSAPCLFRIQVRSRTC